MTELTNLEICKKIAEIEGVKTISRTGFDGLLFLYSDFNKIYNPLTDDALCFQLMCKYGIQLSNYLDDNEVRMYWVCAERIHNNNYKNPNKATCLAIIEAHNE